METSGACNVVNDLEFNNLVNYYANIYTKSAQLGTKLDFKMPIPKKEEKVPVEEVDLKTLSLDLPSPEEAKKEEFHYLFVADCKLTANIKEQLSSYSNVASFDKHLFLNRSPSDLLNKHSVSHIWVDIHSVNARKWLNTWVKYVSPFEIIAVWSKDKHSKWISDIKPHASHIIKSTELKKVKSLSMNDLALSLNADMNIHAPANCMALLLGCSRQIEKLTDKQK